MEYLALIYADESVWERMRPPSGRARTGSTPSSRGPPGTQASSSGATSSGRPRARRPFASATTSVSSATGRTPRSRRRSGATSSSNASLEDALDWAARIPAAEHGAVEIVPSTSTGGPDMQYALLVYTTSPPGRASLTKSRPG